MSLDYSKFKQHIRECLEDADRKYNTSLAGNVDIRFKLRGSCAARAGCKRNRITLEASDYYLNFNVEAMELDWKNMVADTIPHEVAHLVTYARPELGKNHNYGWRNVAISLGSTGERCHNLSLTPGRVTNKFKYKASCGTVVTVGATVHNRLQKGQHRVISNTGGKLRKEHFIGQVANTKATTAVERKPRDSKAEKCQSIIRKWLDKYTEEQILASEGFAFRVKTDCNYGSISQAKHSIRENLKIVKGNM